MKKLITAIVICIATVSSAQTIEVPNVLNVEEKGMMLEGVNRNGFETIVQGEEKEIRKAFEDYLEDTYDFKIKSSGGLLTGEELMNSKISEKRFNLFAMVKVDGEGSHLRLFMAPGLDIYFNSSNDPREAVAAKAILKSFVKDFYGEILNDQLEKTNEEIEDVVKVLSGFQDEEQDAKKAIAKSEKSIAKADAKLKKNQEKMAKIEAANKGIEQSKTELQNEIEVSKKKENEAKLGIDTTKEKLSKTEAVRIKEKSNLERVKAL